MVMLIPVDSNVSGHGHVQGCVLSFTVVSPDLAELWLAAISAFQENTQARLGREQKPGTVPTKQPECSHFVLKI